MKTKSIIKFISLHQKQSKKRQKILKKMKFKRKQDKIVEKERILIINHTKKVQKKQKLLFSCIQGSILQAVSRMITMIKMICLLMHET